jgi:hypothetical protein
MKKVLVFPVLVLSLFLVGCNAPVVTAVTQATIDNAALISALSVPTCAAGVTPVTALVACLTVDQKTEVLNYAQAASVGVGQVAIILAAGGTATQMSLEIASALAPVASPLLPGLPAIIVTAIGLETRDIQAILTAYSVPVAAPAVIKLGSGDINRLKVAHANVVILQGKIAGMKGK